MTASYRGQLEERDKQIILDGLQYGAMCNEHLLAYSNKHPTPYPDESKIRKRSAILQKLGLITTRYYAIGSLRNRAYHTLTAKGYRVLYQTDPPATCQRLFRKISENDQEHHYWKMHFFVKTLVAAHQQGVQLTNYTLENTKPVTAYTRQRHHDGQFRLQIPSVLDFGFTVEIDNHTETLSTNNPATRSVEEWITTYLLADQQSHSHEQVLLITTKGGQRLRHLLSLASKLNPNPKRKLFLGIDLPVYLASDDPLFASHVLTPEGRSVSFLWYPNRLHRLLIAIHKRARTVKELLRNSQYSAYPFTSAKTIHADLRKLYHQGLIQCQRQLRHGQAVFFFKTVPKKLNLLLLWDKSS